MKLHTGYHYTSLENWKLIKRKGLKPYDLSNSSVGRLPEYLKPKDMTHGIFVYDRKQKGLSLFGVLGYHCNRQHSADIVLIEVKWRDGKKGDDVHRRPWWWIAPDLTLSGTHDLYSDDKRFYCHFQEPFHMLFRRIPPSRLKMLKKWNLRTLVK